MNIIENSCPKVEQCTLPPNKLSDNQSLLDENTILKKAWAFCASQVDMIIECQEKQYEKTTTTTPGIIKKQSIFN